MRYTILLLVGLLATQAVAQRPPPQPNSTKVSFGIGGHLLGTSEESFGSFLDKPGYFGIARVELSERFALGVAFEGGGIPDDGYFISLNDGTERISTRPTSASYIAALLQPSLVFRSASVPVAGFLTLRAGYLRRSVSLIRTVTPTGSASQQTTVDLALNGFNIGASTGTQTRLTRILAGEAGLSYDFRWYEDYGDAVGIPVDTGAIGAFRFYAAFIFYPGGQPESRGRW